MKQFVLVLLCLLIFLSPTESKIITGEIEYNAETAAEKVFEKPIEKINYEFIRQHLIDYNAYENMSLLISGVKETREYKMSLFSDGSYGIMYFNDPYYSWYYKNGRLINFTKNDSLNYPTKTIKYKPDGSIANIGLKVSSSESFIYTEDGKLIAHWHGNMCYDSKNNIIMTRKSAD